MKVLLFFLVLLPSSYLWAQSSNSDPNQQGQDPNQQGQYPNQQGQYPNQQGQYPNQQGQYPNQQGQYLNQSSPNPSQYPDPNIGSTPYQGQSPNPGQNQGEVSYQTFYETLSPYGQWVNDPNYGYAWVPNLGPDFQPYRTAGHWVYTDYGWTWMSDYSWGWAPFHYGRWKYSNNYGWIWIPGYTWGPAWVAWRSNNGYYGWAPLGPPAPASQSSYTSAGLNLLGNLLVIGFAFSWHDTPPAEQWCFVPASRICSPYVSNYYVSTARRVAIYRQTTIINNTYVNNTYVNNASTQYNTTIYKGNRGHDGNREVYITGPSRTDVERVTGQRINPVMISNSTRPGAVALNRGSIVMYRPPIHNPAIVQNRQQIFNRASTNPAAVARQASLFPAPQRATSINQVQPLAQRRFSQTGLVNSSAVSHLNSIDQNPALAAVRNQSAFKASPQSMIARDQRRFPSNSQAAQNNGSSSTPQTPQRVQTPPQPNPQSPNRSLSVRPNPVASQPQRQQPTQPQPSPQSPSRSLSVRPNPVASPPQRQQPTQPQPSLQSPSRSLSVRPNPVASPPQRQQPTQPQPQQRIQPTQQSSTPQNRPQPSPVMRMQRPPSAPPSQNTARPAPPVRAAPQHQAPVRRPSPPPEQKKSE